MLLTPEEEQKLREQQALFAGMASRQNALSLGDAAVKPPVVKSISNEQRVAQEAEKLVDDYMANAPDDEGAVGQAEQAPELPKALPTRASAANGYNAIKPGNVDLSHRPFVQNIDGSVSSVRSMGAELDGKQMLIPTVDPYGRIMTDDQAIEEYRRSGQNLGTYRTPEDSDRAGEAIHNDQADFSHEVDTLHGAGMLYDANGVPLPVKKSYDTPDGKPPETYRVPPQPASVIKGSKRMEFVTPEEEQKIRAQQMLFSGMSARQNALSLGDAAVKPPVVTSIPVDQPVPPATAAMQYADSPQALPTKPAEAVDVPVPASVRLAQIQQQNTQPPAQPEQPEADPQEERRLRKNEELEQQRRAEAKQWSDYRNTLHSDMRLQQERDGMPWAAALGDLIANKGRNLSAIFTGAGIPERRLQQLQIQKMSKDVNDTQSPLELRRTNAELKKADADGRIAEAGANRAEFQSSPEYLQAEAEAKAREHAAKQREADSKDPGSKLSEAFRTRAVDDYVAEHGEKSRKDAEHKFDGWSAHDLMGIGKTILEQEALQPGRLQVAAATGNMAAATQYGLWNAQQHAKVEAEGQERGRKSNVQLANSKVTNPGVWAGVANEPSALKDAREIDDVAGSGNATIKTLIDLRRKYGAQVLPGGATSEFDLSLGGLQAALAGLFKLGTIQESDRRALQELIPTIRAGWKDAVTEDGKDRVLEQLRGAQRSITRIANQKLKSYGREYDPNGGAAPQAAPVAQPKTSPAPAPSAPAPAPASAPARASRTLVLKDGRRIDVSSDSPEKIKAAMDKFPGSRLQ